MGAAVLISSLALGAGQTSDDCLACHSKPGLKSSAGRSVSIDAKKLKASAHGQAGLECVDCHADLKGVKDFPHAAKLKPADCAACHPDPVRDMRASVHEPGAAGPGSTGAACADCHGTHDIRARSNPASRVFPANLPATCGACHGPLPPGRRGAPAVRKNLSSVHVQPLKPGGLTLAAACADCHGSHGIRKVSDPASRVARPNVIATCGRCHVEIRRDYLEGVHGRDYARGSKDVPVCTDCHDEHAPLAFQDVGSRDFVTRVARVCSRCHDDEALSRRYGLPTSRLSSFYGSFHGAASRLGETRVANCASCHGFHDIRPSSDPRSSVNLANLARTCGQCHAGAGRNFSRGRIHVVSPKKENPAAFVIRVLYTVLIAAVVAVSLLFIAADLRGRAKKRGKR